MIKFLFFICLTWLIAGTLNTFAQSSNSSKHFRSAVLTDSILNSSEQKSLIQFIKAELNYPDSAKAKGIAGMVEVSLHINSKRKRIDQLTFRRLSDDLLRQEVIRVISLLSAWDLAWSNNASERLNISFVFDHVGEPSKEFKDGHFLIYSNESKIIRSIVH